MYFDNNFTKRDSFEDFQPKKIQIVHSGPSGVLYRFEGPVCNAKSSVVTFSALVTPFY